MSVIHYARNNTFLRYHYQNVLYEPSHIHALYGEYVGEFNIRTLEMIEGDLLPKAQELVTEWLRTYYKELQKMWDTQLIRKLPPLK